MNKRLYSEVYAILEALREDFGADYVARIPADVLKFISDSRDTEYTPILDKNKGYHEQGLSDDAVAALAMLKLNYLCETDEEKAELLNLLDTNEQALNEKMKSTTSALELLRLIRRSK
ncbi:MAG: hypothetical protein LBL34_06265 [Clostridiales bacterium]|jgi:hypothetical protein|nr:hypothetical protein [Clostridiales bacterium]